METKIFVSYSHADEKIKNQLIKHLSSLKQKYEIKLWDDGAINPGDPWDDKIKQNLNSADIILLLLSSDALASDYIVRTEIKNALDRHATKHATVIPIILRPCNWEFFKVSDIQGLPKNAKPISKWKEKDEAFVDITKGVAKVLDRQITKSSSLESKKITVITGLTSSGKDTLLIYLFEELNKKVGDFHFLDKITTRNPRAEEAQHGASPPATAPYYVKQMDRVLVEKNEDHLFFNVFFKYGHYTACDRNELLQMLGPNSNKHVIYVNSDISNIEKHISELKSICLSSGINASIKIILLDCDTETCRRRLRARGLDENARMRKMAEIEGDSIRIQNLKNAGFFDHIVINNNNEAINSSLPALLEALHAKT